MLNREFLARIMVRIARWYIVGLLLLPLGCSSLPGTALTMLPAATGVDQVTRRGWVISESSSLLVMPLQGDGLTARQGFQLQQQLQRALAIAFAEVALEVESSQSITPRELAAGHHYYLVPQLLHSEDRSGSLVELIEVGADRAPGLDAVQIKLLLFDARNQELLDTTVVHARSRWFTLARRTPQQLLQRALQDYALQLSALGSAYR